MKRWKALDTDTPGYMTAQLSSSQKAGLAALRETLRAISATLPGFSFKTSAKVGCVWIVMMQANHGTQEAVASAKTNLTILDDAMRMKRDAFRERLEGFLRQNGFEI